jgi:hypothetical protein
MTTYFNEEHKERVAFLLGMLQASATELHDSAEEDGQEGPARTSRRLLSMLRELRTRLMPATLGEPGEPEEPFDAGV